MNLNLSILITVLVCSLWSSIWLIIYSEKSDDWMYVVAGGPVIWLVLGFFKFGGLIYNIYYKYNWKAVVVDKENNLFWCESKDLNDVTEEYDVKPAFEFAKNNKFKPYKPKTYNFTDNPRYVHRSLACKYSKIK